MDKTKLKFPSSLQFPKELYIPEKQTMPLFDLTPFKSHSGAILPWKVECDAMTDKDWEWAAAVIAERFSFCGVEGVPEGGVKLEKALKPYVEVSGDVFLIVDDVLTTEKSMEEMKEKTKHRHKGKPRIGVVLFSRCDMPMWINSVWKYWW